MSLAGGISDNVWNRRYSEMSMFKDAIDRRGQVDTGDLTDREVAVQREDALDGERSRKRKHEDAGAEEGMGGDFTIEVGKRWYRDRMAHSDMRTGTSQRKLTELDIVAETLRSTTASSLAVH